MEPVISLELKERFISFLKSEKIGIQIGSHSMDVRDLSNTLQLKLILPEGSDRNEFIEFTELHAIVNQAMRDFFASP
ncbi:hypothetical protein [Leptospira interrogans]|uniref:Uncharacterized protein n=3 Tax=Leptospira interrogans TaxID=173 RepID=A0AAP9WBI0_LEPIR|nr:hypothetical protein [Leptospira interrogans]QOI42980.1 hypothetical protein Lepto782_12415 [Leptospira interrogans serovar Canicola]EKO26283.1 hypothetical protein LEP1GSC104_3188 [Leptospira interrogans str. UI 12621]MBM2888898.1 hypothetical protein [Leptospira interrogans]QOI43032.1 hypothetical protein Lepto782_12710 [Leptospira interrogans serovar Canicola]QOI52411.1 hypothetical protein Lepto1489_19740 [Leptospira interrogans serovar Bataviae]